MSMLPWALVCKVSMLLLLLLVLLFFDVGGAAAAGRGDLTEVEREGLPVLLLMLLGLLLANACCRLKQLSRFAFAARAYV
jgi:hypothetical protein